MFELVLAHFVGDYLIQNDWMANNKKQNSLICFCHVCFYTIPFFILNISTVAILLIALQHFIIDRTNLVKIYMEAIGQHRFLRPPMFPWSYIIVDNLSHVLWIWIVMKYLIPFIELKCAI